MRIGLIILCMALLALMPVTAARAASLGLSTWALQVVPAMFPYMMLARMLLRASKGAGAAGTHRVLHWFGCPNECARAILLGWVAGNPMGAYLTGLSAGEADRDSHTILKAALLGSACSPAFILGALGGGRDIGALLLISHWLGVVCGSAILARCTSRSAVADPHATHAHTLTHSSPHSPTPALHVSTPTDLAAECAQTMLTIGGYIVVATVAAAYVQLGLLALNPDTPALVGAMLHSLLEMAGGTLSLITVHPTADVLPLVSMALAFGGLSIALQALAFLRPYGVRMGQYLLGKAVQGICAYAWCWALMPLFNIGARSALNWPIVLQWLGIAAMVAAALGALVTKMRTCASKSA